MQAFCNSGSALLLSHRINKASAARKFLTACTRLCVCNSLKVFGEGCGEPLLFKRGSPRKCALAMINKASAARKFLTVCTRLCVCDSLKVFGEGCGEPLLSKRGSPRKICVFSYSRKAASNSSSARSKRPTSHKCPIRASNPVARR